MPGSIKIIMSGCMETDKPLISIVMAVYEPRMDWLREQLESLNTQTYPNLELIICDDCSKRVLLSDIINLANDCITSFPLKISRNEKNLGSNGTFERLTEEARGEYIAYCDQDDVWLPEKLEKLYGEIAEKSALLICSDMFIIDENGRRIADSLAKVRKHHVFRSGAELASKLLFSNFVTGCTMLIDTETAKKALPFCPYMVHDHWLALFCADRGIIISIPECLINYRIHSLNQTLSMAGVHNKDSYKDVRIVQFISRMRWLSNSFKCSAEVSSDIKCGIEWLEARKSNMEKRGGIGTIWRYRRYSPLTSIFEIILARFPNRLFMLCVEMKRKNLI